MIKEFVISTGMPDSEGDIILPSAIKLPLLPVSLTIGFRSSHPVGYVIRLRVENSNVVAEVGVDEEIKGLYPVISFTNVRFVENEFKGRTFTEIKLRSIGLSQYPNIDNNIKPIE